MEKSKQSIEPPTPNIPSQQISKTALLINSQTFIYKVSSNTLPQSAKLKNITQTLKELKYIVKSICMYITQNSSSRADYDNGNLKHVKSHDCYSFDGPRSQLYLDDSSITAIFPK